MAAVVELQSETLLTVEEEGFWKVIWKRFRKHKLAVIGMIVVGVIALACAMAPLVAPYDPLELHKDAETNAILRNAPPTAAHIMGTDTIGRDVFSRLLHAGRISLMIAFIVVIISETLGALIGAFSGYFGGWIDDVIQRFTEFMITIPLLPLLLAFSALLRGVQLPGLQDEWNSAAIITIILVVFGWMGSTRLVRGNVLSLRNQEFTEAARALGANHVMIILRHMIPNALSPVIVSATLSLGGVIILESALSFLGFRAGRSDAGQAGSGSSQR